MDSNKPVMLEVIDSEGKIFEAARDVQNAVLTKTINPYYIEGLIVECLVNYYYEQFHQPLPDNYTVCRKISKARDILTENFQIRPQSANSPSQSAQTNVRSKKFSNRCFR